MSRELDVFLHFFLLSGALLCWGLSDGSRTSRETGYIGLFLVVTGLFDAIAATIMLNEYLAREMGSNLFLYHILTPVQYVIIFLMYRGVIMHPLARKIATWSIPAFVILSLLLTITVQPPSSYNSYSALIKHVMIIFFVLIYFYEVIATTPYTKVYAQPIFWISVAFLFHSSLNILLEGVSNYLRTYGETTYEPIYLWYSVSNYCLFLLAGVAMLVSSLKPDVNG